jgi:hypothetical protein
LDADQRSVGDTVVVACRNHCAVGCIEPERRVDEVPALIRMRAPEHARLVAELRSSAEELRLVHYYEEVHCAVNGDGLLTVLR